MIFSGYTESGFSTKRNIQWKESNHLMCLIKINENILSAQFPWSYKLNLFWKDSVQINLCNRHDTFSTEAMVRQEAQGSTYDAEDNSPCNSCSTLALFHSLEGLHGGGGTVYICLWCQGDVLTHLKWFMERKRLELQWEWEKSQTRRNVRECFGNKEAGNEVDLSDRWAKWL